MSDQENEQPRAEAVAAGERRRPRQMSEAQIEARWQNKLLPLMSRTLGGLTIFFFVASLVQLYRLEIRVSEAPKLDLAPVLAKMDQGLAVSADLERFEAVKWETRMMLEEKVVQNRYHQANVLLLSRIWTQYIGFVTGMILALVGAVFILGKLRESASTFNADSNLWKVSMTTASPGLLLALFGTVLMMTTILTHNRIDVNDAPTYISTVAVGGSAAPDSGAPQSAPTPAPIEPQNAAGEKANQEIENALDGALKKLQERKKETKAN